MTAMEHVESNPSRRRDHSKSVADDRRWPRRPSNDIDRANDSAVQVEALRIENRQLRSELAAATARAERLVIALNSTRTLGAAVDVVMTATGLTEPEAFELVLTASQLSNRQHRSVAGNAVYAGTVQARKKRPDRFSKP